MTKSAAPPPRSVIRRLLALFAVLLVAGAFIAACSDEAKDKVNEALENTGDETDSGGEDSGGGGDSGSGDEGSGGDSGSGDEGSGGDSGSGDEGSGGDGSGEQQPDTAEEGLSSEDWLIIVLLGVAAIAIILIAMSAATSRSEAKNSARAVRAGNIGQAIGGARWVHDQGSIDVLRVSDPQQLQSLWPSVRARIVDLEGQVATMAVGLNDPQAAQSLNYLGQTLAGLRGALESNVGIRLDPNVAANDPLLQNSTQSVYDRRNDLQTAITPLTMMR